MKNIIKLIRIKHWIKNILIFIPLIFSKTFNETSIINSIIAFFSFSLMASVIYIINDIKDIEKDKLHPKKKLRPIASGKIKISFAIIIIILLFISSVTLNYIVTNSLLNTPLMFLLSYFIINLLYSLGLKNIRILDIALLSTGFILRVYYGASIINVEVSNWLFLTILSASLFLGLGKRQKELLHNKNVRGVLKDYDAEFLENFMNISTTLLIVFYSLWTMEQNSNYLFLSIPLVIIIFMEYSLYMKKSNEGDPITILFENKSLMLTVFIYGIFMLINMVI